MIRISKTKIVTAVCGIFGVIVLCMLGRIGEEVKNETIVVNQFPISGRIAYWTEPGFHWQMFGRTTTYYKTQQFWFGGTDMNGDSHGNPIKVRFRDGSEGFIYGSLRVSLPMEQEYLSKLETTYHGMERLMNELVATSAKNAIYTTGSLMTAFESYAEKKNELRSYIEDQLSNGIYKTTSREEDVIDPITGEKKKTTVVTLVKDTLGNIKRDGPSPFSKYGIIADQVSITDVMYEDKVVAQISKQQEANMDIQTARAQAAKAQQEAIRAEEQGKADAAKARWEQEKIKATEVTKAEQEYEVAVTNARKEREASKLAAEKAEFDKKRIIAEGEAEAAANRAKVAAGLTPQERAEWEYKTKVGVAEAISEVALPRIVMTGGSQGGSAMDAMGLKMIMDIADKLSK